MSSAREGVGGERHLLPRVEGPEGVAHLQHSLHAEGLQVVHRERKRLEYQRRQRHHALKCALILAYSQQQHCHLMTAAPVIERLLDTTTAWQNVACPGVSM